MPASRRPAWRGWNPRILGYSVHVRRKDFWVRDRRTNQLRLLTPREWREAMQR